MKRQVLFLGNHLNALSLLPPECFEKSLGLVCQRTGIFYFGDVRPTDILTSKLFSQAVFLMIEESKDFLTLMVCHRLEPCWRQETHITGKKLVLLVIRVATDQEMVRGKNYSRSGKIQGKLK